MKLSQYKYIIEANLDMSLTKATSLQLILNSQLPLNDDFGYHFWHISVIIR